MEKRQINSNYNVEGRTVEGYAVIFNSQSENLGFYETIHQGAITQETINNSDVLAKFNHNDEKVLARSKNGSGSLLLEVDEKGLRYMFDSPMTELGNELLEYLNRGDITSSSFCFTVPKTEGAERWYKKDGVIYRDIYQIDKLYDVSPVFQPAYEATTCSKRFNEITKQVEEIDNIMNLHTKEIEEL